MPKRERKSRNKAKRRRVDFSGVQAGGRRRIPSGDYPFKIVEISEDEGDAGTYWTVVSEVMTGKHKGFKDYNNYSFSSKALWKLRQLLEACGIDVPESSMNLNPRDLIGLTFGGSVALSYCRHLLENRKPLSLLRTSSRATIYRFSDDLEPLETQTGILQRMSAAVSTHLLVHKTLIS